jgi:hypothetical protein
MISAPIRKLSVTGAATIAGAVLFLLTALPLGAQANPNQVALLHWYLANTTASFVTQTGPWGTVFDGTNIWVVNSMSNSLSKFRPSDGALLGTYSLGHQAQLIAYDGANLWVTDSTTNTVTKVRPSDGAILATTSVTGAHGIVFDGTNLWVATSGTLINQLRVSDGAIVDTFKVMPCQPYELAFDGANLWATCGNNNQVLKVPVAGGTVSVKTVGTAPYGMAFDGANMWVSTSVGDTVWKLRASDMAVLGTYPVGSGPQGVAFDGANIWVANYSSQTLTKLRASDGFNLGSVPTPSLPSHFAFDGAHIWTTQWGGFLGKF